MGRICVLLAPGFEEIEAITVIDVLRRAELETVTLSIGAVSVQGAHGITVQADGVLASHDDELFDLIVLPGGMPGSTHLRDDDRVQALLSAQHQRNGKLAAICAAPIALSRAGVLKQRTATSYPGFEEQLDCGSYRNDTVVVDGPITTSRGPGTALAFALSLVSQLRGPDAAAALAQRMLIEAVT